MASHFITLSRANTCSALIPPPQTKIPLILLNFTDRTRGNGRTRGRSLRIVRVSDGRDSSYLDMWKKAVDRERDDIEFQKIVDNYAKITETEESVDPDALAKKSNEFQKILEVSKEERDRVQRMHVIDQAAAAIAAARALLMDTSMMQYSFIG